MFCAVNSCSQDCPATQKHPADIIAITENTISHNGIRQSNHSHYSNTRSQDLSSLKRTKLKWPPPCRRPHRGHFSPRPTHHVPVFRPRSEEPLPQSTHDRTSVSLEQRRRADQRQGVPFRRVYTPIRAVGRGRDWSDSRWECDGSL